MIPPGDSLTVRFTPPRAGTFMYHSHANEMQQISSGLYGTIVVSEPGAARDPSTDHVVVFADGGPTLDFFAPPPPVFVNGSASPAPLVLEAARTHRLRLVNIRTEFLTTLALLDGDSTATWRVVAKDGATIPAARVRDTPARLLFAPGEIYDVEITPRAGRPLTLRWEAMPGEARTAATMIVQPR
jgi:FtsP/CotA-like multicopper oxidase with cupredoxin domain